MLLPNLDACERSYKSYGGHACQKEGIIFNGSEYMIKFPEDMRQRQLKNVEVSYSNGAISEYLGSRIYRSIGIPTHEVFLGMMDRHIVAACKDFEQNGFQYQTFHTMRTTIRPSEGGLQWTPDNEQDLDCILHAIEHSSVMPKLPMKEHFWDMFVIDAFIGNADRNNDNWGILRKREMDGHVSVEIAPVFDNGNCLNPRLSEQQMADRLENLKTMETIAYTGCVCFFMQKGYKINPFSYMKETENPDCLDAIMRIVPNIQMKEISSSITELKDSGIISDVQSDFYQKVLTMRYEEALIPILEKTRNPEHKIHERIFSRP